LTFRNTSDTLAQRSAAMAQEVPRPKRQIEELSRDVRFCPYCFLQQFDLTGRGEETTVYCEMCGVDVEIRSLARP
jgi:hypothetical protein